MEHEQEKSEDDVIYVRMPIRDYKIMRDMIDERKAMSGLKKWVSTRIVFVVGTLLSIVGLIEAFKRLSL